MPEYGIKVSPERGSADSRTLFIYFTPMSYLDWLYCTMIDMMYDTAIMRSIFETYITKVIAVYDKESVDLSPRDLIDEPDNIKMHIMDSMVEKAGFGDEKKLLGMVRMCRDKSNTLAGTYDAFVMMNTDFSFYTQFLCSDIFTRSQIISSLEKTKQFTVEQRYLDAMNEGFDVNLIHGPDDYEQWKTKMQKKKILREQSEQGRKPAQQKPELKEVIGEDLNAIIEASKRELANAMKMTSTSPVKAFDWESDEKDYE